MLNPFPIQFLAPLAYVLLRVAVGSLLLSQGARMLNGAKRGSLPWSSGLSQIIIGTMYILGLYTQIAALGAALVALTSFIPSLRPFNLSRFDRSTAALLLVMSLALFITGAGPFAFDLPI